MALSKEERETIILTSDADDEWQIYTCQQKIMTKMKNLGIFPFKVDVDKDGNEVAKYYKVGYKQVSFRKESSGRNLTDEQREELAERMRKARQEKN
jgi:hypothetical protein